MTIIKSHPFGIQRKIVANMTADSYIGLLVRL